MPRKSVKTRRGPSFPNRPPTTAHLKPKGFEEYLTIGELARELNKDISWIRKLERRGDIPEAVRHRIGRIHVRLYPPARVREIQEIVSTLKVGRPRKGG